MLAVALLIAAVASGSAADLALLEAAALHNTRASWVILDARPAADWEAGHIPGAIPFIWERFTRTDPNGVKYSTLPPGEAAAVLAGLGLDEKSAVVIYGDADKSWGGEGYGVWLLSWLGHKGPIRLLNGGIDAWRSQNLPLVKGIERSAAPKTRYTIDLKTEYRVVTEDILREKSAFTLIDTRSTIEWFRGKIPGAIHIPWQDFHVGRDRRPLSAAELQKLLAKHRVDISKPVVFYCLGGVRSAYAWVVYRLAGLPDGRNYAGGWAAWEKRK